MCLLVHGAFCLRSARKQHANTFQTVSPACAIVRLAILLVSARGGCSILRSHTDGVLVEAKANTLLCVQPFGLGSLLGLVAPADAARSDGGGTDAVPSPGAAAAAAAVTIPGLRALDSSRLPLAGAEPRDGLAGTDGTRAATTVLRGLDEVARHRQRSVAHVAFVLDCGGAEAAELLTQCCWDEPAAIDAYHARHAGVDVGGVRAARLGTQAPDQARAPDQALAPGQARPPSPPQAPAAEPATAQCIVCFERMRPAEHRAVQLPCRHATCTTCWKVTAQTLAWTALVAHVSTRSTPPCCCPATLPRALSAGRVNFGELVSSL